MTPHISTPQYCTNPDCPFHKPETCTGKAWYRSHGSFATKARGNIPRFHCTACKKTFSTQSFSIHYWTHSTVDYQSLAKAITSSSGLIQYCRHHRMTYRVLQNRVRHLSRNCLALMDLILDSLVLHENLCFDGLESFLRSQMFPDNINIMAGSDSQFLYAFTCAIMRRKGRKTEKQKAQQAMIDELWKPVKNGVKKEIISLLEALQAAIVFACAGKELVRLYSDQHKAYRPAILAISELKRCLEDGSLEHIQLSSTLSRTVRMRLFPVNYIDRLVRKDMGEHGRETVKQGREINCQLERMAIFQVMHNFLTPHRVSHRADQSGTVTHADKAGIPRKLYGDQLSRLFTHRFVRSHLKTGQQWIEKIWLHGYENPPAVDFETGERSKKCMGISPKQMSAPFMV
jgi:hypothetical protein